MLRSKSIKACCVGMEQLQVHRSEECNEYFQVILVSIAGLYHGSSRAKLVHEVLVVRNILMM